MISTVLLSIILICGILLPTMTNASAKISAMRTKTSAALHGRWIDGHKCPNGTVLMMHLVDVPMSNEATFRTIQVARYMIAISALISTFCTNEEYSHTSVVFWIRCPPNDDHDASHPGHNENGNYPPVSLLTAEFGPDFGVQWRWGRYQDMYFYHNQYKVFMVNFTLGVDQLIMDIDHFNVGWNPSYNVCWNNCKHYARALLKDLLVTYHKLTSYLRKPFVQLDYDYLRTIGFLRR